MSHVLVITIVQFSCNFSFRLISYIVISFSPENPFHLLCGSCPCTRLGSSNNFSFQYSNTIGASACLGGLLQFSGWSRVSSSNNKITLRLWTKRGILAIAHIPAKVNINVRRYSPLFQNWLRHAAKEYLLVTVVRWFPKCGVVRQSWFRLNPVFQSESAHETFPVLPATTPRRRPQN